MDMNIKTYGVEGMHCAGCVSTVEKALQNIEGVHSASVNLNLENVRIKTDAGIIFGTLRDAVKNSGYTLIVETVEV